MSAKVKNSHHASKASHATKAHHAAQGGKHKSSASDKAAFKHKMANHGGNKQHASKHGNAHAGKNAKPHQQHGGHNAKANGANHGQHGGHNAKANGANHGQHGGHDAKANGAGHGQHGGHNAKANGAGHGQHGGHNAKANGANHGQHGGHNAKANGANHGQHGGHNAKANGANHGQHGGHNAKANGAGHGQHGGHNAQANGAGHAQFDGAGGFGSTAGFGVSRFASPTGFGASGFGSKGGSFASPAGFGKSGFGAPSSFEPSGFGAPTGFGASGFGSKGGSFASPAGFGKSGFGGPASFGPSGFGASSGFGTSGFGAPTSFGKSGFGGPSSFEPSGFGAPTSLSASGFSSKGVSVGSSGGPAAKGNNKAQPKQNQGANAHSKQPKQGGANNTHNNQPSQKQSAKSKLAGVTIKTGPTKTLHPGQAKPHNGPTKTLHPGQAKPHNGPTKTLHPGQAKPHNGPTRTLHPGQAKPHNGPTKTLHPSAHGNNDSNRGQGTHGGNNRPNRGANGNNNGSNPNASRPKAPVSNNHFGQIETKTAQNTDHYAANQPDGSAVKKENRLRHAKEAANNPDNPNHDKINEKKVNHSLHKIKNNPDQRGQVEKNYRQARADAVKDVTGKTPLELANEYNNKLISPGTKAYLQTLPRQKRKAYVQKNLSREAALDAGTAAKTQRSLNNEIPGNHDYLQTSNKPFSKADKRQRKARNENFKGKDAQLNQAFDNWGEHAQLKEFHDGIDPSANYLNHKGDKRLDQLAERHRSDTHRIEKKSGENFVHESKDAPENSTKHQFVGLLNKKQHTREDPSISGEYSDSQRQKINKRLDHMRHNPDSWGNIERARDKAIREGIHDVSFIDKNNGSFYDAAAAAWGGDTFGKNVSLSSTRPNIRAPLNMYDVPKHSRAKFGLAGEHNHPTPVSATLAEDDYINLVVGSI